MAASFLSEALHGAPRPKSSSPPAAPTVAPLGTGAGRCWKSRRAKYAHLPPITIQLIHAWGSNGSTTVREELRVDQFARAGDLSRDLCAGGPSVGLLERLLGLPTPPTTPRGKSNRPLVRVAGIARIASTGNGGSGDHPTVRSTTLLHARERLEEGGEYAVEAIERDALDASPDDRLVAGAAALGVTPCDSSDWSDDPDAEPL